MHQKSSTVPPAEHGTENKDMELQRTAHMFKRIALVSLDEEIINMEQREHRQQEIQQATTSGFASIARSGCMVLPYCIYLSHHFLMDMDMDLNGSHMADGYLRLGMLSHGNTSAGRWLRAGAQATAATHAKKMREMARLKALQRTPYPMVLARIKLLLDKLQVWSCEG